jgi:eukaryotic translation initiation factor 2-alpha kinase 4
MEPLTSNVGTQLYMAPELSGIASKVKYTKQVDLYSLGIILFEMLTPPFKYQMEKCKVIAALRSESITFPKDCKISRKGRFLISQLLTHDPVQRPSLLEIKNALISIKNEGNKLKKYKMTRKSVGELINSKSVTVIKKCKIFV